MRKSSTSRRSFSNPVRVSTLELEDKSGGRSDARRTQILKSKAQSQVDNSQIPRPRITSSSSDRSRLTSSSSDRSSIRRSNLKAPAKTPLHQQQLSAVRISTATTPLHAQVTPRVSTNRATLELPTGLRHRSPSAERASGFGAKGPKKDSRPLTDKTYQTSMLNKIDAYFAYIQQSSMLNQNGSLKPITLKIFVDVTSCLLNLLEVKHHLTIGNYMEEIPKIAKKLHYPAIITKSWLKTANTMHSWPQVLGWLSWLVEVCEAKDLAAESFEIDKLPFVENDVEAKTNRNTFLAMLQFYGLWNEEKLEKEAALVEEYIHKINNQHGDIDKAIRDSKEDLENEEASIQVANQQSAESNEQIGALEDLLNTLKSDELQEIDRISSMENHSRRNILEIEQLNVDVNVLQDEIEKDTVQQAELNLIIEKQPMSIKERDDIVQECSEIQNYIRHFDSHVKDLEKELYAMDIKFAHTNQQLFNAILAYNNDIIMHLDCNTGADLEELKLPETNMLSPDFPDLLRIKESAMLNLKENARMQLNHNSSVIETSVKELESLKDKLRSLREENKDHVAKLKGQKQCIQQIQHRAKKNEVKLKEQMKSLQADIIRLQQSLPDLESVANELEEAQDKFEAIARRSEFFEKKAERFFNKFYQISVGGITGNDKVKMFSRLFLRGDVVKGCLVSHAQVGLSQTISPFKPTITRALHLARDVRSFTASRIQLSNLRSGVCKQNEKIFTEGSSRRFASVSQKSDPLHINTDVTNNVYLFKYDRPRFFKILNASGIFQLIIWLGIAYAFTKVLPKRDPDTTPWKKYLLDNLLIVVAIPLSTVAGIGGSLLVWTFAARSVRFLILNKGGKEVTIITYHPLNKTITTVPVSNLNCKRTRKEMKHYLPVKMRGRPFFYVLDKNGEFVNPTLFDYTIGAR